MSRPIICALGVCRRDLELAEMWLRWTAFLAEKQGERFTLLVMLAKNVGSEEARLRNAAGGRLDVHVRVCTDEIENSYPKSASHLFLRTLERAEFLFPGHAVLWCEADTVPMKPSWFAEIAAEWQACGKPFLGVTVGTKFKQMSGIAVYGHDWRERAPKLAAVLSAPDMPQWGPGRGMPWDVYARDQTYPQMAESRLMTNVWKNRDMKVTRLREIPEQTALFHQDKTGAVIRELAALRYPEFMSTISQPRRFYFMNGHPTRLAGKGLKIAFSYHKFEAGNHRSAVCSDELSDENAAALATLVGQLGVREIDEAEFLKLTDRLAKSLPPQKVRPLAHTPAPETTHSSVFVMLGRYGDVCNILPLLKAESDAGRRPTLVVSKDFQDILDGVSYCDRIVWDGAYDQLPEALRWLRRDKGIVSPVVCQVHRNPLDKARLTDSYQKEVWRLAGRLDQFETRGELDFDRRDIEREEEFLKTWRRCEKPLILVGLDSVSSPFANARATMSEIIHAFQATHEIVDLSDVHAHRIYDLLALFYEAQMLVSTDTVFLHLARASSITTIAILNDGWRGSVVEHAFRSVRYASAHPAKVVELMTEAFSLMPGAPSGDASTLTKAMTISITVREMEMRSLGQNQPRVIHAVDTHGTGPRFDKARESWKAAYDEGMIPAHFSGGPRNAKTELGDPRELPFLKDVLQAAMVHTQNDDDVVIWSNSDSGFAPGLAEFVGNHVRTHGAASMRRTESNGNGHPGRDLFAFTAKWLRDQWASIPDYVLGAPVFDLGLVAMIRSFHGLPPLTLKSLSEDMSPSDMAPGFLLHESHAPEWQVPNVDAMPSVRTNKRLFREWNTKHKAGMKFSPGGNLK